MRGGGIRLLPPFIASAFAVVAVIIVACPGDEYHLGQTHRGDSWPWKTHFESMRNICLENLCEEGDSACLEDGTHDIFTLVQNDRLPHVRDRFAFFQNCGRGCLSTNEYIDGGETVFQHSGRYWWYEGRGEREIDFGTPNIRNSIGFVRRYERGSCSRELSLSSSGLVEAVGDALQEQIENARIDYRVTRIFETGQVFLGSENCSRESSENRDFISLTYTWGIEPRVGIGDFGVTIRITWRFVSNDRWRYLACGGDSCSAGDEVIECETDEDCADLIGARCRSDVLEGERICVRENALDVADESFEFARGWNNCWNYWCRWRRRAFFRGLADTSAHPYRDFYAQMLARIEDEHFWQPIAAEDNPCTSDDDCTTLHFGQFEFELAEHDLAGRCHLESGENQGACEVRPLYVYGVNTYPDALELILARTEDDRIYGVLSIVDLMHPGEEEEHFCDSNTTSIEEYASPTGMDWF